MGPSVSIAEEASEVSSPVSSRIKEKFRKTHKRNESKLSRISHLSVRSLRGNTLDDVDEADDTGGGAGGQNVEAKRIYFLDRLLPYCPCLPRLSLPGYCRISFQVRIQRFHVGDQWSFMLCEHIYRIFGKASRGCGRTTCTTKRGSW